MKAFSLARWAALACLLSGCAGLEFKAIPNDAADAEADGFRYYDTSPFLLVYTDGKGGLTSSVLYLPDTTKLRSVRPYSVAAKNDVTLKFVDGRLTQAKAVVDETIIPKTVIGSLEKVASATIKAANGDNDTIPSPYIFRIVQANGAWSLVGGAAVDQNGKPASIRFASE